jgi:hypothetical protein
MPTPTYTALATVTLGSSAASVTFSSIPATYRDLVLVINMAGTSSGYMNLVINSDSSNFTRVYAVGSSGGALSAADSTSFFGGFSSSFNNLQILNFMDYSATDKHKTILIRENIGGSDTAMDTIRWASTSAITTIQIGTPSGDFASTSTLALYGIAS